MRQIFQRLAFSAIFFAFAFTAFSQSNFWSDVSGTSFGASKEQRNIIPEKYRTLTLDTSGLKTFLLSAPQEFSAAAKNNPLIVSLPMPDGSFSRFSITETAVMEPGLAASLPDVKTYGGQGIDDPYANIKLDWSLQGFHAMILSPVNGPVFIDPYSQGTLVRYISYKKADLKPGLPLMEGKEKIRDEPLNRTAILQRTQAAACIGGTLRTYRLAVACTGEYARAVGGSSVTVAKALSAIVTTVNRVDGVYEAEVDIRLILINNNSSIVFTNPATDPFTGNNDAETLIKESQEQITSRIGSANFDIGHTFSTGGGGLTIFAGIVCDNDHKASAVTGSPNPVGDPYDIDFVAHEIGHEFGATHPFNATTGNCFDNADNTSNVEPGSGSTIMAYAGICEATNDLQPHSDPQFHTISTEQITDYITKGDGNNCAVKISTGNKPPVVNAGLDYAIPKSTPFVLSGSATDPDGNALTYSWEQINAGGPFGDWNSPSGDAPIFRSFPPVTTGVRYFPRLSDILNNKTTIGEILPSYGRTLNFRLTARDNHAGGGGVCSDEIAVDVVDDAGPFVVTSPNTAEILETGTFKTITWNVAGTSKDPVNCTSVNIELSTDGGLTFPVTLALNTPNDGSEEIIVPNNITSTARIRIKATNNIFFAISNPSFTIKASQGSSFVFNNPSLSKTCDNAVHASILKTSSLNGFASPVTLSATGNPAGTTVSFSANPINPGGQTTVTLQGTVPTGIYSITVTGTSGSLSKTKVLQFSVGAPLQAPVSIAPANKSIGQPVYAGFSWNSILNADSYTLQISAVSDFSTIVQSVSNITATIDTLTTPLALNTQYYWRVAAVNSCSTVPGPASAASLFKTVGLVCQDPVVSTDVPVTIDSVEDITSVASVITIPAGGVIADIDVVGLKGRHSNVNDLTVSLMSPKNTSIVLFDAICFNDEDFYMNFDDSATASASAPVCPPTIGQSLQPLQPLSSFNNENSAGDWTLIIDDYNPFYGGTLTNWGLRICTYAATALPVNWLTFTGHSNPNGEVVLQWSASELNNQRYEIERSKDGITFTSIGSVNALHIAGTVQQYFYNDVTPTPGVSYYRLKQVDKDGRYNYSAVVKVVTVKRDGLFLVYPNPATDHSTIRLLSDVKRLELQLSDAAGRQIYKRDAGKLSAGEKIDIPLKGFSKGLYVLTLTTEKGTTAKKITVQ